MPRSSALAAEALSGGRAAEAQAPLAVTCARQGTFGANTPCELRRCTRGGGISTAYRSRNSSGVRRSGVLPRYALGLRRPPTRPHCPIGQGLPQSPHPRRSLPDSEDPDLQRRRIHGSFPDARQTTHPCLRLSLYGTRHRAPLDSAPASPKPTAWPSGSTVVSPRCPKAIAPTRPTISEPHCCAIPTCTTTNTSFSAP